MLALGALDLADARGVELTLVGDPGPLERLVGTRSHRVAGAARAITHDDSVRDALRGKIDSSMRRAIALVAAGEADAVVSAGNTGALMALARHLLPMLPGIAERRTPTYIRHGTTSLFAALDVATGFVIGKCYKRHRAREFLAFLKEIDARIPAGLAIHIVMDNYATHKTATVKAWLARRPHYQVHFTPTSASWINQVERWFAALTRKQLRRGVHTSTRQLEADIRTFIDTHNADPKPFIWTKSADAILVAVKRFCLRVEHHLCHEL